MENRLLIADSITILDLEYKRESQSIVEPKLALKSAPPRANPLTVFSAAIEEIFLIDLGVSNYASRFMSGKDDMDDLSFTFGNIYAFMDKLVRVKSLISS